MSGLQPFRILLVEDEPAEAELTAEALREADVPCELHVAGNGGEALDFIHRRGSFAAAPVPDLVLLDLNLPKTDGRQVLDELKSHPDLRRIPVIVLTTSAAPRDVLLAYNRHANAYVRKPIGYAALVDLMRSIDDFWIRRVLRAPEQSGAAIASATSSP